MSGATTPIICLLNAAAGAGPGRADPQSLADLFAARGCQVTVKIARDGAELASLARRAADGSHKIVVAGGGDGTVNCIASAIVGSTTCLGVLPLGTLNHFARDMKIPLKLEDAVSVIASGQPRRIDVGEVNGKIFLNNSSLGLYPQVIRGRDALQQGGSGKWMAFARATASVLLHYSQLNVQLRAGNAISLEHKTPLVFIGNNRYRLDGWNIGSRERLDEGKLWLYMAPSTGPAGLAALAFSTLLGRMPRSKVESFETIECRIVTRRKWLDVATDGEITLLQTPLLYRSRPGALQVMVAGDLAAAPILAASPQGG